MSSSSSLTGRTAEGIGLSGGSKRIPATCVDQMAIATDSLRVMSAERSGAAGDESFLESLMDTSLYSMGAYFSDQHPDLVDEVIAESEAIERSGLRAYAVEHEMPLEACFETLLTGLAVRYYNAVAA
jgi:hypothetical protein